MFYICALLFCELCFAFLIVWMCLISHYCRKWRMEMRNNHCPMGNEVLLTKHLNGAQQCYF